MNDEQVVWEDPPGPEPAAGGTPRWVNRLSPLLEHPGKWARVYVYKNRYTASAMRRHLQQRHVKIPEGDWEFTFRSVGAKGHLYARYLGNGASND